MNRPDTSAAAAAYAAQRGALDAVLRAGLPPDRAARVASLVRDAITLTPRKARKADEAVGASRLGGCPDLPEGAPFPQKEDGFVEFVCQLRLEDLAPLDVHGKLPPRGLLSFFHGFLTNGLYDAETRVYFFPDAPRGLVTVDPPRRFKRRGRPRPRGVDFAPEALLPPHSSPLVPLDGPDDPYCTLFDERYDLYGAGRDFHGHFGFDRPLEGEQRADEELLLRFDGNGCPYDLVEAACACFFIPAADLARADFSRVRLHEGASI